MTTADARRTREFMRGLRSTDCGRARLTADGGRQTAAQIHARCAGFRLRSKSNGP
jgi:hypothetical protein